MILLAIILFIPPIILCFVKLLKNNSLLNNEKLNKGWLTSDIIFVLLYPIFYLIVGDDGINDCCGDSAFFSPNHRLTMYFWFILCSLCYFIAYYRKKELPPILLLLINTGLAVGIVLNVLICIHHKNIFHPLFINIPLVFFYTGALIFNYLKIIRKIKLIQLKTDTIANKLAYLLLTVPNLTKFPILILLCFPLIFIASAILLLFGQQPDSIIQAFTDTYKHGFSQLDYLCDNVQCGGHYLCSVAAKGHKKVVKPIRLGVRHYNPIICNRQLLISNAFEEIMEENIPNIHKKVRRNYDKIGDLVHKHYSIFNIKWVSDIVYVLMKPLELLFWLTLYSTQVNPENKIALQYVNKKEKQKLLNQLSSKTN